MLYEKLLASHAELARTLRSLDQDAGVRVVGKLGGKKVLVFVTRFGPKYTMMAYGVRPRTGSPGRRLATSEFDSADGVEAALMAMAPGRLRAWLY